MKCSVFTFISAKFSQPRRKGGGRKTGSALLVTLLVLSLLLTLVMAFVAFVRQELRNVTSHQELLQARANARLGLELAVARLQETAGPDTRVTAPVFPDANARPNSLLIGQALDAQPFLPGNSLQLNPRYGQSTGYFLSHDPNENFDPRSYWPFLGGTAVEPGNVLLIGPGTVSDRDANADGIPDGYVAAPLRPIHDNGASHAGHFAYHIRDNGMQAQINLVDSFRLENNGRLDLREQAITAQRVASEFLLPNFDPDDVVHQDFLGRVLETSQLDLTPFVGQEGAGDYYHGITLQSLGLPVNVQTGGFRRDLTAVMREMEDNLRNGTNNEEQLEALFDFQAARMQRWREQTEALEGVSRPADMPRHRWNALNAITLRDDQNRNAPNEASAFNSSRLDINPPFREKVFPPMSDMAIRHDPGGASWRQLLSHATRRDRLLDSSGSFLQVNMPGEATAEINPVVARLSYNFYMTLDWPTLRMHYVPVIVLWNPYNVPIGPAEGQAWHFVKKFEADRMRGLTYQFLVQHDDWNNGQPLWTPSRDSHIMFNAHSQSYNYWHFRLLRSPDNPRIVIPPGEALIFSLNGHERVPSDAMGNQSSFHRIDLVQGLFDDGGYSFYLERDVEAHFKQTSEDRSSAWGNFPLYDTSNPDTLPHRDIAVNENGLSNWTIENSVLLVTLHSGRSDSGFFRDRGLHLLSRDLNWTNVSSLRTNSDAVNNITHLYMRTPRELRDARVDSLDDPTVPNLLNFFGGPPPSFVNMESMGGQTRPFIENLDPAFPSWGMAWGLRMPMTRLRDRPVTRDDEELDGIATNFTAPSRWLVDYNPTSPFILADPTAVAASQNYRYGGFVQPGSYVGGFSIDDRQFRYHEMNPEGTDNLFIGLGDAPFWEIGTPPKLVLYEIPVGLPDPDEESPGVLRGSEELASLAAFMHARPHSTGHAFKDSSLLSWWAFGSTTNNYAASDHLPNSPVYAIGNSFASKFVPREKASHSVFPGPTAPSTSTASIPYLENDLAVTTRNLREQDNAHTIMYIPMYDTSYIYNRVLWDDFILTPSSNRRLVWRNNHRERDFDASASRVMIAGAFNINSTSVSAWAAMLSSMLDVEIAPLDGSTETNPNVERVPLARFLDPGSAALSPNASPAQDFTHRRAYSGYRRLTEDEIYDLAGQIVEQVKLRGPFLSLSAFVNRMLLEADEDPLGLGLVGALQAAINDAGLNDVMGTPSDRDIWQTEADFAGSWRGTTGNTAFHGLYLENIEGAQTAASPGYLLQSDVLSRIGSVLQPRSDTFTVRAYGSLGPETDPASRVWVEAVVQRRPDFVESFDETTGSGNRPEDLPEALSDINQMFGRRFEIISFRWLNQEDI